MTTTRDDSKEKLTHALTLLWQAEITTIPEMRTQHLTAAQRLVEMVRDSIDGDSPFLAAIGNLPN